MYGNCDRSRSSHASVYAGLLTIAASGALLDRNLTPLSEVRHGIRRQITTMSGTAAGRLGMRFNYPTVYEGGYAFCPHAVTF